MRIENYSMMSVLQEAVQRRSPPFIQKSLDPIFRILIRFEAAERTFLSKSFQVIRSHGPLSAGVAALAIGIIALSFYYFRRPKDPLSRQLELEPSKPSTPAAPAAVPSKPAASTSPAAPVVKVTPPLNDDFVRLDVRIYDPNPSCPAIFNDRAYEYNKHLTTWKGEKIVVKPTDRHICLEGRLVEQLYLPSCLFIGKKDGDVVEYKWDDVFYRLTLVPTTSKRAQRTGLAASMTVNAAAAEQDGSFQATFQKAVSSVFCRNFKPKDVEGIPQLFGFLFIPKETTVPILGSKPFDLKFYEKEQEYKEYRFLEQTDYGAIVGPQMQLEDIQVYDVDNPQESYFLLLIPHKSKLNGDGKLYYHGSYMVIAKNPKVKYLQLEIKNNNYLKYEFCSTPAVPAPAAVAKQSRHRSAIGAEDQADQMAPPADIMATRLKLQSLTFDQILASHRNELLKILECFAERQFKLMLLEKTASMNACDLMKQCPQIFKNYFKEYNQVELKKNYPTFRQRFEQDVKDYETVMELEKAYGPGFFGLHLLTVDILHRLSTVYVANNAEAYLLATVKINGGVPEEIRLLRNQYVMKLEEKDADKKAIGEEFARELKGVAERLYPKTAKP